MASADMKSSGDLDESAASTEMNISELARQAGVSTATVHFYVREGLLPAPRRLNRTRAAWSPHHLRLLRLVSRLKANGLPLAVIARMMRDADGDDADLRRLEDIGYLQPLPVTRGTAAPIEHFEPVSRDELLARAGLPPGVLAAAEAAGIVRPRVPGRYDARDLWALRQVAVLLADGVSLQDLPATAGLVRVAVEVAPLVLQQAAHHEQALKARTMRFRDVLEPLMNLQGYVLDRVLDEQAPGWRERVFVRGAGDAG
jgi:DNA-binding transcriptional MerR regulator